MNILYFKLFLAQSEFTPKEVLEILAKDERYYVRGAVTRNSNVSEEILEIIAKDKNPWVRESVAENLNTPKEILESLAKDEDLYSYTCCTKS